MFRIKTFMVNFQNDWNYKTKLFYKRGLYYK